MHTQETRESRQPVAAIQQQLVTRLVQGAVPELGQPLEKGADLVGPGIEGHALAQRVQFHFRKAQRLAQFAQGGAGPEGVVGRYPGYILGPIFTIDILDHLVPVTGLEVDIDIGHPHPFRIHETFKQQAPLQGIHLGDAQTVSGQGISRRTPSGITDTLLARVAGQIPDYQEVIRKSHLLDYPQLIFKPLGYRWGDPAVTALGPLPDQPAQNLGCLLSGQQRKTGKMKDRLMQEGLAALGDAQGIGQGLGASGKQALHLDLTLHITLAVEGSGGVDIMDRDQLFHAAQDIMEEKILMAGVVNVVGGHHFQVQLRGQLQQALVEIMVAGQKQVLQFYIEGAAAPPGFV
ncbi:MAG: hypothetical protein BWY77_01079 [bacterium ADurb.Bin431]|nr:MAG: hypothetical protein BWY77_01079 [bacterium ADurb.Bin431]